MAQPSLTRKLAAILPAGVVRTGPAPRRHRALKWSVAAGVAVAATALAVFAAWLRFDTPPTATTEAATARAPAMAASPEAESATGTRPPEPRPGRRDRTPRPATEGGP